MNLGNVRGYRVLIYLGALITTKFFITRENATSLALSVLLWHDADCVHVFSPEDTSPIAGATRGVFTR